MSVSSFVKKSLLFLWLSVMTFTAIAQATVNLTSVTPRTAQANVSTMTITGSGFPATVSAGNVTVTLALVGGGSPVNTTASSVATVSGSIKRVVFQVPSISVASPTQYQVSITDNADGIPTTNAVTFTLNPPATISTNPTSGSQNTSVPITITGQYTSFVQGVTTASFPGGSGLSLSGFTVTSTTQATATLNISSTATSASLTVATGTQQETSPFTVNVPVTNTVSGQIKLLSGAALAGATVTLSPGGLTGTTDAAGNYTIASVPGGTYTVTPSFTFPTGSDPADSAVFYPANVQNVNVNSNVTENFGAQLGYTVKGTVTYPANALFSTGAVAQLQTYVRLQNPNCSNCTTNGTSVLLSTNPNNTASKAFVIHGVYPTGTLTAQAWADNYGYGKPNIGNPSASNTITVTNADVTGVTLALSDAPVPADPGVAPTMTVSTIPNGVAIAYQPIVVGGIEQAASYDLNWSTLSVADCEGASNPPGSTTSGGLNVLVTGYPLPEDSGRVIILDGSAPVNPFNVPNLGGVGTKYYFCMRGNNVTAAPFSTWATAGPITFVGASTTGINTIVPVTIPSGVTVNNVPLYVGCYDSAHSKFYAVSDEAPTVGTRNYSVYIPSGTSCNMFAALDLDLDGLATPSDPFPGAPYSNGGDIFNLGRDFTKYTITSPGTIPVDLTPYKGDTRFLLATQHTLDQNSVESFGVNFDVSSLQSIPVSVQLQTPSPSLNSLLDFAACTTCGQGEFNVTLTTSNVAPSGTYKVNVINSNIPVPAPVAKTATVTGVNNAFTTSLSASGGGTPTFLWGYPASPASYTYKFKITDQYGNVIWQVPVKPSGFDSTAITAGAGFPSTVTQIAWGTDPTGNATNVPTLSSLPSGTYIWSLTTIDSNGNTATQQQVYTF